MKSGAKQANLVVEMYQFCLKFPSVRTDRPRRRILLFTATVLPSSASGYEWSKTKHMLLMMQSFLYFCLLFIRCRCSSSSVLLTHLLFHFSQKFCIIFLIQRVWSFQTFFFKFLSEIIIFVDQPHVNMNFMLCIVLGF